MSGQWKGALTGSMMARRAPRSLAISKAISTAPVAPLMTIWPGALVAGDGTDRIRRQFAENGFDRFHFDPDQRRHGAFAEGHCHLHRLAARFENLRRVGKTRVLWRR